MAILHAHTVVSLGDIAYYVRNRVEYLLPLAFAAINEPRPATVIHFGQHPMTLDFIEKTLARFKATDDVFTPGFVENSILVASRNASKEPSKTIPEAVMRFLVKHSSEICFSEIEETQIPEGPYFVRGQGLHQAWRLYPDESRAFVTAIAPADQGDSSQYSPSKSYDCGFQPLHAGAYSGMYPVVSVPSRLYFQKSAGRPLHGCRISVKDNFHISGVHTTVGSRSYTELYGKQNQTSILVQRLIDLGVVIVGKTKMGAYASSEVPPEKTIDYFAPWNPRGDGYQGPSGSSSGAASSLASYSWLDFAFGTDTTGSIRMPAASYGLWGLRSTWGTLPFEGVVKSVVSFETMGLLSRTPSQLHQILSVFESQQERIWPKRIIYPVDWFPMKNENQQKIVEHFISGLAGVLGTQVSKISLEEEWSKAGPEDHKHLTLDKFLDKSIYWPNYYDGYHNYDGFRKDYRQRFDHKPYASPFMTKRWGLADDITEEQRDQGLREIQIYSNWIENHILGAGSNEESIAVIPLGRPGANYRDVVPAPGGEFSTSAYDPMDLSTVVGLPQLVIPIGQNPYESKVTDRVEYAPIVTSLVGPKGSDLTLLQVAEAALKKVGLPTEVLTGQNAFDVARKKEVNGYHGPERL